MYSGVERTTTRTMRPSGLPKGPENRSHIRGNNNNASSAKVKSPAVRTSKSPVSGPVEKPAARPYNAAIPEIIANARGTVRNATSLTLINRFLEPSFIYPGNLDGRFAAHKDRGRERKVGPFTNLMMSNRTVL